MGFLLNRYHIETPEQRKERIESKEYRGKIKRVFTLIGCLCFLGAVAAAIVYYFRFIA